MQIESLWSEWHAIKAQAEESDNAAIQTTETALKALEVAQSPDLQEALRSNVDAIDDLVHHDGFHVTQRGVYCRVAIIGLVIVAVVYAAFKYT